MDGYSAFTSDPNAPPPQDAGYFEISGKLYQTRPDAQIPADILANYPWGTKQQYQDDTAYGRTTHGWLDTFMTDYGALLPIAMFAAPAIPGLMAGAGGAGAGGAIGAEAGGAWSLGAETALGEGMGALESLGAVASGAGAGGLSEAGSAFLGSGGAEGYAATLAAEDAAAGALATGAGVVPAVETGMQTWGPEVGSEAPYAPVEAGLPPAPSVPPPGNGAPSGLPPGAEQAPAPVTDLGKKLVGEPSMFDEFLGLVKQYPGPAASLAGGVLSAAGGVGAALLGSSANDKKIQAEKDLLAEKTTQEQAMLDYKRGLIQSGSYFGSTLPVQAPAQPRPLRRPDGSLVFGPNGLINTAPR